MRLLRVHCAVLNARTSILVRTCSQSYGGHGERETPGHIPNPEAKPLSADGTALETGWESRTPPDNHSRRGPSHRPGPLRHARMADRSIGRCPSRNCGLIIGSRLDTSVPSAREEEPPCPDSG